MEMRCIASSILVQNRDPTEPLTVLSVRIEVGVSLLLTPAVADKGGPKAPFPPVENAGIQLAICKRVPDGAPMEPGLTESTAFSLLVSPTFA